VKSIPIQNQLKVKENRIFLIFETFKCRKKKMSKTEPFKTAENPWSNALGNSLGNALGTHWETHWETHWKTHWETHWETHSQACLNG
jgi:hypothetical protein